MPFRFYFNGVQTYIDPFTACVGVNFKKEMKLSFEQMEIDVGTTSANRVKREATRRESVRTRLPLIDAKRLCFSNKVGKRA
jgi:hypothetical protein